MSHPLAPLGRSDARALAGGGQRPWNPVYPFFGLHLLVFAGSGLLLACGDDSVPLVFLYAHGGCASLADLVLHVDCFGRDVVDWMLVNAVLDLLAT